LCPDPYAEHVGDEPGHINPSVRLAGLGLVACPVLSVWAGLVH
jgi:hypothetical protein